MPSFRSFTVHKSLGEQRYISCSRSSLGSVGDLFFLAKYDTKDKFSNLKIKQFPYLQAKTNNHIEHIYQDLITHDNGSVLAAFVVVITV